MPEGIKSYLKAIKEHAGIILILGCSYGSLISFIVYGPVMLKAADGLRITVLSSLGLAFVVIGIMYHKAAERFLNHRSIKKMHVLGTITCILLFVFGILPYLFQAVSVALLGFTAGGVISYWAHAFASVKTENRIKVICLGLLIAYGTKYLSNIMASYLSSSLITLVPALLILCSVAVLSPAEYTAGTAEIKKDTSLRYREFFFLIFIIYFTAGITYVGIFPQLSAWNFQKFYNVIPFLAAVFVAGIYANNIGRKYLLYAGISFLGLSFTFYAVSSGVLSFFLIQTSSEISWAFLNVYVLVLLYDLASAMKNTGYFIFGLISIVCGTLFGGVLTTAIIYFFPLRPATYGAMAHILLFIAIGFLSRIPEPHTKKDLPQIPFPVEQVRSDLTVLFSEKYGLTRREIDVALLILAGYSNPHIAKQLFISPNTAKFHTKNIYLKLNVNSRNEIKKAISEYVKL